jgi:hypothetical protein
VAGIAGEEGVERCVVQEALALGGLDGSGELVRLSRSPWNFAVVIR